MIPGFAPAVARAGRGAGLPDPRRCACRRRAHGPHDRTLVIDAYDAFLRDDALPRAHRARGGPALRCDADLEAAAQYLLALRGVAAVLVDGGGGLARPDLRSRRRGARRCRPRSPTALADRIGAGAGRASEWTSAWLDAGRAPTARRAAIRTGSRLGRTVRGRAFARAGGVLPDGAHPLRRQLACRCATSTRSSRPASRRIRCLANRGANGIDGVVSTALGAAAVDDGPVVLVIGDISFFHDLNGLLAARLHGLRATIVVVEQRWRRHLLVPATGRRRAARRRAAGALRGAVRAHRTASTSGRSRPHSARSTTGSSAGVGDLRDGGRGLGRASRRSCPRAPDRPRAERRAAPRVPGRGRGGARPARRCAA